MGEHTGSPLAFKDQIRGANPKVFKFGDMTHQKIGSQNGFFVKML
jgi:hypothetical protein